jgi:hypothetical protein
MKVSLMWWNTSLSPRGISRANQEQKLKAQAIIDHFITSIGIDLIALGEVNSDDIEDLENNCQLQGYRVLDRCSKAGRAKFDICLLYNRHKLALVEVNDIISKSGARTFKVAQRFVFTITNSDKPLFIFASHWPSRLNMAQNHPDRAKFAMALRDEIEELLRDNGDDALIVVLGDFNDEPFDHSLSEYLMASRDRQLVKRKKHLLYNPFWRKLGHSKDYHVGLQSNETDGGSYYYKAGNKSRWWTFDQMMFSSGFIGNSDWYLDERLTCIWRDDKMAQLIMDKEQMFDHFPVTGVIEKVIS